MAQKSTWEKRVESSLCGRVYPVVKTHYGHEGRMDNRLWHGVKRILDFQERGDMIRCIRLDGMCYGWMCMVWRFV